ncbi:outer membrane beta-barrel family protein [Pedobacter nutrimenti]|uniref:Outer membrane receptor protein involved in Fe transport n=1 Tax=Pedobacter nutrimenti TaxID=1241337 RepID=A0A318ULB0_9SPHI|nr:outer membrane beta-barrel family protein [Pedobacter nutrimenti]PYF74815.1 outer membrane receptor protein involved in Fe transport [Pedobacter nutrimenti]
MFKIADFFLFAGMLLLANGALAQSKIVQKVDTTDSAKLKKINLQGVEINFKKALIEKKVDRTVFNVERSVAAIGTDALELMAKVPGIRVVNDRVSLVGKGSVNIMINDKLSPLSEDDLANYLRSIPSDRIAKIEVITNPSAKYDAQGNNGLINIVLKKIIEQGFKGSANLGFTQAIYPTGSAGGNLSFKKDKITLFSNFNIRKGSTVPFEQSNVFYPDQTWNVVNRDRNFRLVPGGQIGMDYQASKNTLIGFSYNRGLTNFHSEENIKTRVLNKVQSLDSVLNSDAHARIRSNYNAANLYLKGFIDSLGKQVTINADWFKYEDNNQRFFDNRSFDQNGGMIPGSFAQYLSSSAQNLNLYTLKADADLPYTYFNLSLGTKLSFIKNESGVSFYKSRNDVYEPEQSQSNRFSYRENTQALYVNVNKTIKKWDFQLGLRSEYTQIKGTSANSINENDYLKLFPTLFIVYRLKEKSEFSLSYGRRINRPAYKKLNPFRWYNNQYFYSEGNPFLQPSYSNNVELSHTYAGLLTSTLSFNNTSDGYNEVNFTDPDNNIQILRPVNFVSSYKYQLSNSITFNQLKWWESLNQLDVFYIRSRSSIAQTIPLLDGFGAYFSTLNQFIFNKSRTMMGDVNFWCQFAGVNDLNQMKSQYSLDIGVKRLLLDKKLQLALNISDILKSRKDRYNSLVNNIRQEYDHYYDSRYVRLSIRYNFGNDKMKPQDHKPGNEEERKRSN